MPAKTKSRRRRIVRRKPQGVPPVPPNRSIIACAGNPDGGPNLWNFNHTHPSIPGIINCVVRAPNITEARAAAYLLADQFASNAIGMIRAQVPPPQFPAA